MTRSEALAARLKNNRIVAVLVVVAAAITGVAQFTDASQRILSAFDRTDGALAELNAALGVDLALLDNGISGFLSVMNSAEVDEQTAQTLLLKRWADNSDSVEKICAAAANPKILAQKNVGPMLGQLCRASKFVAKYVLEEPYSPELRFISVGLAAGIQKCLRYLRQELTESPSAAVPEICGQNMVNSIQ